MTTQLLVLGGEWVEAVEGGTFDVVEPGTGVPMATVAKAGAEDARRAVGIARRAFDEGPGRARVRPSAAGCCCAPHC